MTITPLEFGLQSNPGRYGPDSGGRLINAYPEEADERGKARFPLYPIEGLAAHSTLTNGGKWRGGIELNGSAYISAGTGIYKVDSVGGTYSAIGSFPGSAPTFMASNRKATPQIALVSDGLRYIIESDTVTDIADSDLPAANSVEQLNGYFVWSIEDGRMFASAIDEGTTIDALDFAEAESQSDKLQLVFTRGRELMAIGTNSIEFWTDTAGTNFPFSRTDGATIRNLGCLCRHSVRSLNDVPFFVATDGTVRRLNGYQPERVSTHAVERAIDTITNKDAITATAYQIRGKQFYILSSPSWTWGFDGLTGVWHERESYQLSRWRGEGAVTVNNVRIVGDYATGVLYSVDPDTYDEAGNHLVWKLVSPPIHAYPRRAIFDRVFLDTIPGTGLNSTDDHVADPQVVLRWSDDSGKTWSNQRSASTGQIGEYSKRVKFEALGETKEDGRMFEVSMSAAVVRGLTGAAADVELIAP